MNPRRAREQSISPLRKYQNTSVDIIDAEITTEEKLAPVPADAPFLIS
jgi:hypothetical protein